MPRPEPHNNGVNWWLIVTAGLAVMLGVFFGKYLLLDRGVSASVALPLLALVAVGVLVVVYVRSRARNNHRG